MSASALDNQLHLIDLLKTNLTNVYVEFGTPPEDHVRKGDHVFVVPEVTTELEQRIGHNVCMVASYRFSIIASSVAADAKKSAERHRDLQIAILNLFKSLYASDLRERGLTLVDQTTRPFPAGTSWVNDTEYTFVGIGEA